VLCNIRGIKIVYPSNGADLKGLLKAAYYDPNPVVVLEHKGLYWSKVPGTAYAKTILPAEDYVLPLGKAAHVLTAAPELQGSAAPAGSFPVTLLPKDLLSRSRSDILLQSSQQMFRNLTRHSRGWGSRSLFRHFK